MVFDSFNVEWSKDCTKDYLFIGAIAKYTKVIKFDVYGVTFEVLHFELKVKHM